MKKIIGILLLLPMSNFAQIPLGKIVSFVGNKYSVATDWLIENNWEFKGLDTTEGLNSLWSKGYKQNTNLAEHWLRLYFYERPKINKDSVYQVIYMILSQQEYLDYYKGLPSLGFGNKASRDFQGTMSTSFEKKPIINGKKRFIVAELMQFTNPSTTMTMRQFEIMYLNYY